MQYVLIAALFFLMVSVGMSLRVAELFANWRRHRWGTWLCLLAATFLIPPLLALLLANLFRLTLGETAGLFLVGAAPGAPLLMRNMARRGYDLHMAASYQLWAGLLVPLAIPAVVAAGAKLYGRDVWIPPSVLFKQIAVKQLLPLAIGMAFAWLAPKLAERLCPKLNTLGNALLLVMIVAILIKLGPALKQAKPLVPVATILLAVGSIGAVLMFRMGSPVVRQTFAICNANRHVGLALLLTGQYVRANNALPTVVCYALTAPLIMFAYAKLHPVQKTG